MTLIKRTLARIAACSVFAIATGAASADTYDFVLSGDYSAHWQLQSSVVPDDFGDGAGFVLWDTVGTFPGASEGVVDMYFFHADNGGGLELDDFYADTTLMVADGPQVYTGTEDSPTFMLGTFALDGTAYGFGTYTLTITNVSAVPEPASLALMLGGLGLVGFTAKRRMR